MFLANGCLLFHSVEYVITPVDGKSGSAVLTVEDIKSDAINSSELDEDKKNLFDFMHKSDEFINQMKGEGKIIKSRKLIIDEGKLIGKIIFDFDDIEIVEGIIYEEPFYYLTLSPADSIISTNGEVIRSDMHKRIIWDNSIKVLKFKMFRLKLFSRFLSEKHLLIKSPRN
jgi:hypothetical protein